MYQTVYLIIYLHAPNRIRFIAILWMSIIKDYLVLDSEFPVYDGLSSSFKKLVYVYLFFSDGQNNHRTNLISRKTEYDWKKKWLLQFENIIKYYFQIGRTRQTWSVLNISLYYQKNRWETAHSNRIDRKYSWWYGEYVSWIKTIKRSDTSMLINCFFFPWSIFLTVSHTNRDKDKMIILVTIVIIGNFRFRVDEGLSMNMIIISDDL